MKITIIGASGFIGSNLYNHLEKSGHEVLAVTRNQIYAESKLGKDALIKEWDGSDRVSMVSILDGTDVLINLAGENIGKGRWNKSRKAKIVESRIIITRTISKALQLVREKPKLLIQASAVGYYGSDLGNTFTEFSAVGKGYIAKLVSEWESETEAFDYYNIRTVFLRTGVVIGKNSFLIKRLKLPFKLYLGGNLGSGNQWISWIHLQDLMNIIVFMINKKEISGPVNIVAPEPVRLKEFLTKFASAINRPSWLTVPAFILKLLFGEMAKETILASQKVKPEVLENAGYEFNYPDLESALKEIFDKTS